MLILFELSDLNGNCYTDPIQTLHGMKSHHKMKNRQICHKNLDAIWICLGHPTSKETQTLRYVCSATKIVVWNTDQQKFIMSTDYMTTLKNVSQKYEYANNQTRPIRYEEKSAVTKESTSWMLI